MYTYKNKTDQELVLIGIGKVAPNQEFQTATKIENPNIALINDHQPQPEAVAASQVPASNPVAPTPAPAPIQVAVTSAEEAQQ